MKGVWIGTSGWSYAGWRGSFYPPDVPQTNWLRYYATVFATTEINTSFYRTPTLEAVKAWREQTPRGFLFAWKASKFITHWKRLGPIIAVSTDNSRRQPGVSEFSRTRRKSGSGGETHGS